MTTDNTAQAAENATLRERVKAVIESMEAALASDSRRAGPAALVPLWIDDLRALLATPEQDRPVSEGGDHAGLVERLLSYRTDIVINHNPAVCKEAAQALTAQAAENAALRSGLSDAIKDIAAERARQVSEEGWTPEHDDEHADTQLAGAAACYVLASVAHWAAGPAIDQFWPWDKVWWKPADKRRNLVKAGALITAEIERLDRAVATPEQGKPVSEGDG